MYVKQIATVGLVAASVIWAAAAHAATITIGSALNGGGITTRASGTDAASTGSFSAGMGWNANIVTGQTAAAPDIFNSTSQNTTNGGSTAALDIFVTASNLTSPVGSVPFLSTFTTNAVPSGWTVTESTFLDARNTVFGTTTSLGSDAFTGIDTGSALTIAAVTAPYSITQEYIIRANGISGSANSTMDVSAVPIPGTLPLFASGLGALGLLRWRKKRKAPKSALPLTA